MSRDLGDLLRSTDYSWVAPFVFWSDTMVNHRHGGSGRITDEEQRSTASRPSRARMRNGNQPADIMIEPDDAEAGALGDQHAPREGSPLGNVTDGPRDSSGLIEGMSTFEKESDGDVGPIPGAPLDPANEAASPITTPVLLLIVLVVLIVLIAALAAVL